MNYTKYPDAERYAVTIHEEPNNLVPPGWPAAVQPLPDGQKAPDGHTVMTGKQLNKLCDSLAHHWPQVHENIAAHRLQCRKEELLHEHNTLQEHLRQVHSGEMAEAIASASTHEDLQGIKHALNTIRS